MPTSKNPTNNFNQNKEQALIKSIKAAMLYIKILLGLTFVYFGTVLYLEVIVYGGNRLNTVNQPAVSIAQVSDQLYWVAPDTNEFEELSNKDLVRYGKNLVSHTAAYLGPRGVVKKMTNGINCQNCHLDAGTKLFGNNLGAVASKYPVVQARSGTLVSIEERVNGCLERSLNGQRLENESVEMKAFVAYLEWLGKDVDKKESLKGFGLKPIPFIDRPADVQKGRFVYYKYCMSCHGKNGEGLMHENKMEWKYPPLYGSNSYNIGAGLYRISKFASFVLANMPYGVSYDNPVLTVEEAWDVAAFINTMEHPSKDISKDWPDISKKPIDHPFGPFLDQFSERQHKYGPYHTMGRN